MPSPKSDEAPHPPPTAEGSWRSVWRAQLLDTLAEQNGCPSGAGLGIPIARLRRRDREHRPRHPDDGDRMQEDEDDEDDEDAIRSTAIRSSRLGNFR
jgi:hypothetical protein